jgi:hypothetical protein
LEGRHPIFRQENIYLVKVPFLKRGVEIIGW